MKTRIAFIGEEHWVVHLATLVNRYCDSVSCTSDPVGWKRTSMLRAFWHLLTSHVVVRVGFPPPVVTYVEYDPQAFIERTGMRESMKRILFQTSVGRRLRRLVLSFRLGLPVDWAHDVVARLRPSRCDVYYWIGTDVLRTLEAVANGALTERSRERIAGALNLAVAPHLVAELESVGIPARPIPFPAGALDIPEEAPPLPAQMTAISYVPDTRREFYGMATLLKAARALPEIRFLFFRGTGESVPDLPKNVEFLGFVEDMHDVYAASSVIIRLVEHDGDSSVIAEGLLYARPVIYSYARPHTIHVPFGDTDGLVRELSALLRQHQAGGMPLNDQGREWAMREYDPERRLTNLLDVLLSCGGRHYASPGTQSNRSETV